MNHKEITHLFLGSRIKNTDTVVDMTAGNGHDTLFLAKIAKKVIAVDIQKQAIESTKETCKEYTNIQYINKDHSQIDFMDSYQAYIYNLGYLPGSDKKIITNVESTVSSLKKAIATNPRFITIASYRGHDGGEQEYRAIKDLLESEKIEAIEVKYDSELSPVTFLIDFVKPSSSVILVDELRRLPQKQAMTKLQSMLQLT